jgi:disulfide bond formation protein DsbB
MKMNNRVMFGAGALVCAALLAYAYYLQYAQGLEPCPLCLMQRGFFYAVMALFVLGALHGPGRTGAWIYSALIVLFAAGGAATAGRQVWLQSLPADKVPACGPDLFFMLNNLPLMRTLQKVFQGSGECAVVDWKFLGLSIAGWSLVWFVVLACYALWLALRRSRSATAAASP